MAEIKIIGRHVPLTGDVDIVIAKFPSPEDEGIKKELLKKCREAIDKMTKLGYTNLRIEEGGEAP